MYSPELDPLEEPPSMQYSEQDFRDAGIPENPVARSQHDCTHNIRLHIGGESPDSQQAKYVA